VTRATDDKGNVLSEHDIQPGRSPLSAEYKYLEFDGSGNWTKRNVKSASQNFDGAFLAGGEQIETRTIEYYP
jgi:hypothetical protein